jgi:hypothetical protein
MDSEAYRSRREHLPPAGRTTIAAPLDCAAVTAMSTLTTDSTGERFRLDAAHAEGEST